MMLLTTKKPLILRGIFFTRKTSPQLKRTGAGWRKIVININATIHDNISIRLSSTLVNDFLYYVILDNISSKILV